MGPREITKAAAAVHVALVAAAAFYTLRINNDTSLSEISFRETAVMFAVALLPAASAWLGLKLARGNTAEWLLATGQAIALLLFAATFVFVLKSVEPMAPLLFFVASIYLAGGLLVLLIAVWIVGRRAA